jgi:hypothetical protein
MVRRENEKVRDRFLKKGKSLNTTPRQTEYLQFKDIASSLNGYARFVSYKVNQSHLESQTNSLTPEARYSELEYVAEGQFRAGLKNGYCRSISANDGSSAVGFHLNGVPQGKWSSYKPNGQLSRPEGLYEGTTCTQQITIHNYETRILKTE